VIVLYDELEVIKSTLYTVYLFLFKKNLELQHFFFQIQ